MGGVVDITRIIYKPCSSEGQLSVSGGGMCTKQRLTACMTLSRKRVVR